jgi:NitT/TauT family transport system permease protein
MTVEVDRVAPTPQPRADIAMKQPVSIPAAASSFAIFGTRESRQDVLATVVVVAIIILLMEVTSRFVPDYIMPSPLVVLKAARELFFSDASHVLVTIVRLALAVAFALTAGVLIGLAMGMLPWLRPFLKALVVIDTGIPALSWMLIAVFWFRNPEARIFFILTVILLPFYALNVYEGIRALNKDLIDMIESFRPSRWQVLRYLIFPHIVTYVFLTTKSVIGYAIRMVIFAELVASAIGIGSRMSYAQSTFRIDQVLAWTFFLVILNLLIQAGVEFIEKIFLKWRPEVTVR